MKQNNTTTVPIMAGMDTGSSKTCGSTIVDTCISNIICRANKNKNLDKNVNLLIAFDEQQRYTVREYCSSKE